MEHECKMKERLNRIEGDIKELKDNDKEYSKDMSIMRESHTETKIYIKQIFESLTNLTATLKAITEKPSKRYETIITTIIVVVVTAVVTYFIAGK